MGLFLNLGPIKAGANAHDDIRQELRSLAIRGFAPYVLLGSGCLVSATCLAAAYYRDFLLWRFAVVVATICGFRFTLTAARSSQRASMTPEPRFWAFAYGLMTVLFSICMGALTVYNFRFHGEAIRVLCVMGTYTICSGISSRIGLQPLVSQACIVILQGALAWSLVCSTELLFRFAVLLTVVTCITYCSSIRNQYRLMEEQVVNRRRLRVLADHDSLTGLANRLQFENRLKEVCAAAKPFTLWIIDLDGFKDVNDTFGHIVGDDVLREVADRMKRIVRSSDLLARFGGDEFVILQANIHSPDAAQSFARRIEEEISAPYHVGGHRVVIGASAGAKIVDAGNKDPAEVFQDADRALYQVKEHGAGGFKLA